MDSFDNLLFNENNDSFSEQDTLLTSEIGCLENVEQLANAVVTCLESENYSEMNRQLENIIPSEQERIEYIFDYRGVTSKYIVMTVCALLTLIYLYFLFIGSVTAFFSSEYISVGIIISTISVAILLTNIWLIKRFASSAKRKMRFDVYTEILRFKNLEFVEELALCSKQKESTVIRDLNIAIKQKLIPQGHFSNDNLVFMVSDKVYNKYMEKPAVYDRYFQKQLEERNRVKSRTQYVNQIMESGERYIKKLDGFKTLLKNKTVSQKIERMGNIVSMIFHEIDINPNQVNSLGVFLNYYLPTTEKILDAYVSIVEKKISVPNMDTAKKEIEESLNTIIRSFESILEKLYEEYEMDIESDIAAMELVMKKEGFPG